MKRFFTIYCVAILSLLIGGVQAADNYGQAINDSAQARPVFARSLANEPAPPGIEQLSLPRIAPLNYVPKRPGHYTAEDWRAAIDSTWGPGLPPATSQGIWLTWWYQINDRYSAFQGLGSSVWDSVYAKYSPELEDFDHPVSRGRLAAILHHSALALHDPHSWPIDSVVLNTVLAPGVPILNLLIQGEQSHFGAGLTALPDSTALVYQAVPDHPLGLVPGDIILGYDRTPWMQLFAELMAAELPIRGIGGASDAAFDHIAIMCSGMNWHLFDTIDVVKYATGDTVHLPTSLMVGKPMTIWATEQLDIPGIEKPNFYDSQFVSWGIIPGTTVGYVYVTGWPGAPYRDGSLRWYNAIDSVVNHSQTTGLIIDSRMNMGAYVKIADAGINVLFDSDVETYRLRSRCIGGDNLAMCLPQFSGFTYTDSLYIIRGSGGYHKPIAILLGPASLSGGDLHPAQMAHHPMAKVFGKPSSGAFGFMITYALYPGYAMWVTRGNFYPYNDSTNYLTRMGFPDPQFFPDFPFQEVWLTRDGVAQGRDDVVEAAKAWILGRDLDQDGIVNENDNCPEVANADQADVDHDGLGNLCDADNDGDGIDDATDNCPTISNPTQADANSDGIGDACCCVGVTGNVNYTGIVDLSDLSSLVSYLTGGGYALPCPNESNVNATGIVDLSDLSSLVSYLTGGGYVLPNCL